VAREIKRIRDVNEDGKNNNRNNVRPCRRRRRRRPPLLLLLYTPRLATWDGGCTHTRARGRRRRDAASRPVAANAFPKTVGSHDNFHRSAVG